MFTIQNTILAAALTGCVHAPMTLHLDWRGTDDMRDVPTATIDAFHGQRVAIVPGKDERASPNLIGRNVERHGEPVSVTTQDNVGKFLAGQLEMSLKANGIKVDPEDATRVIKLDVIDFFVEEENTYQARCTLGVTLLNGAGATLWNGTVRGESKRFGRSFDETNYKEALSNGAAEAMLSLLKTAEFLDAVKGKSHVAAARR